MNDCSNSHERGCYSMLVPDCCRCWHTWLFILWHQDQYFSLANSWRFISICAKWMQFLFWHIFKTVILFFIKILFIYLFINERHTQREKRQRHRQREKQAPCREPDDPGSPGSGPGLKAALNHWATRVALRVEYWSLLLLMYYYLYVSLPWLLIDWYNWLLQH